jgi:hypothetical protein
MSRPRSLVDNLGPWRGVDDLEWATLEYVDWFNHRRLMGKTPPAEKEETYNRHHTPTGATTLKKPLPNPGRLKRTATRALPGDQDTSPSGPMANETYACLIYPCP